ncbi:hypothetical protein CspHIS471_0204390 [Cutaneotrichosporon sp. HIS471]|nr:hypothetical protein CspHIS471_0204390 [Cutaneotrichosporon sp. HIS471]
MTYHTSQPNPHILLTPPESPPQTSSYLEHPTPRAHTKRGLINKLEPLPENPNSPNRPHRGSHGPIIEQAPPSPSSPSLGSSTLADGTVIQSQSAAIEMHRQDQEAIHQAIHAQHDALRAQHQALHAQHEALHGQHDEFYAPHALHPREKTDWTSEGPHDVRRSPIPEEFEDPLDRMLERMAPHHEDSLGTIQAKSSQRPPLSREKTPVRPPLVHHDDSGDTLHAEPIGKRDRESHSTDESREPVTHGQLQPPGHQHHHHHHQRRKRGSQPKPLAPPPRRPSAVMTVVSDEVPEALVGAINVPKIVEHLCEVQAADVALVNSIMALDGKVDRLLEHFGVEVGAVGIHGKLDALITAVGAEKRK